MEIKEFKKYLKTLNEDYLIKLFNTADLNKTEYGIAYNSIILKKKVAKICIDLNISRSHYFVIKNKLLLKLYYTLKNLY